MEVLALIGPSGSGKSYRAQAVAHDYNVEAIIDDGLLIQGGNILAGCSAKQQPTRVGAIKAALFLDEQQAQEVRQKLNEFKPQRILIIGTSESMAQRIARRLQLPEPARYISINEIASPREIARAQQIRRRYGKHVIPAPTVEVKSRFSGTIIEPLRIFLRRRNAPPGKSRNLWVEQTTVRPTFTFLGKFYIADSALIQICEYVLKKSGLLQPHIQVQSTPAGISLLVEVSANYGQPLRPLLEKARDRLQEVIEEMTALRVLKIDLILKTLVLPEK
ncbi:MAG: hypothetical protein PWP65_1040 [Clostridia bacterium]|nr:hypothetical protein [Clostridia bacterium]